MKRFFVAAIIVIVAVLAAPVMYSTTHGYTTWWFRRRATVTVNGNPNGFLHRRLNDSALILTRTDTSPYQSYLVSLRRGGLCSPSHM